MLDWLAGRVRIDMFALCATAHWMPGVRCYFDAHGGVIGHG